MQRGVVNGRIGKNKTEASRADIPLDGDFAQVLLDWRATKLMLIQGRYSHPPVTGGCFDERTLMKKHIKPAGETGWSHAVGWDSFRQILTEECWMRREPTPALSRA